MLIPILIAMKLIHPISRHTSKAIPLAYVFTIQTEMTLSLPSRTSSLITEKLESGLCLLKVQKQEIEDDDSSYRYTHDAIILTVTGITSNKGKSLATQYSATLFLLVAFLANQKDLQKLVVYAKTMVIPTSRPKLCVKRLKLIYRVRKSLTVVKPAFANVNNSTST